MNSYLQLKKIYKSVKNNSFVRDVVTVGSGTAVAQALLVITTPILTRLFSPEAFGVLAMYSATASILAIFFTMQYDMAIVLPKSDKEGRELFQIAGRIAIRLSIIFLILAVIVSLYPVLESLGFEDIPIYIPLVSVTGGLLMGLKNNFNYLNIRNKNYRLISIALVTSAIISQLYIISGGVFMGGASILISGAILAVIIDILIQVKFGGHGKVLRKSVGLGFINKESRILKKRYSDFPKYRMSQSLLNLAGQRVPEILLISFFNPAIAGFYSLATRVIKKPGSLITEAVYKVFYKESAELRNRGSGLFNSMLKKTLILAGMGVIPFGILVVISPSLFSFVFGSEWHTAGIYASYIAVWMYTAFCNTPATSVMPVLRKQRRYLIFNTILFVLRVLAIVMGAHSGEALKAILYLTVVGTVYNILIIVDVHIQAYKDENDY